MLLEAVTGLPNLVCELKYLYKSCIRNCAGEPYRHPKPISSFRSHTVAVKKSSYQDTGARTCSQAVKKSFLTSMFQVGGLQFTFCRNRFLAAAQFFNGRTWSLQVEGLAEFARGKLLARISLFNDIIMHNATLSNAKSSTLLSIG